MRFLQCQKNTITVGLTLDFIGSNLDFSFYKGLKIEGLEIKWSKKYQSCFLTEKKLGVETER